MKTPAERIIRRRSFVPTKYKRMFDRCIAGTASPREAIKLHCLECWGYSLDDAADCQGYACPLYAYNPLRMRTKSPTGAGNGSAIDENGPGVGKAGNGER